MNMEEVGNKLVEILKRHWEKMGELMLDEYQCAIAEAFEYGVKVGQKDESVKEQNNGHKHRKAN